MECGWRGPVEGRVPVQPRGFRGRVPEIMLSALCDPRAFVWPCAWLPFHWRVGLGDAEVHPREGVCGVLDDSPAAVDGVETEFECSIIVTHA